MPGISGRYPAIRARRALALAAGALLLVAADLPACHGKAPPVAAAEAPALALTGRVVDKADVLDAPTEAALVKKLADLEAASGAQFVVATTPSLGGKDIDDYTMKLGNLWGLGDKQRDDGLILMVAPNERKVRIEVGLGLEAVLTDDLCKRILDEYVVPRFRHGDLPGGIVAGTDALIEQLHAHPTVAASRKAA